MNKDSLTMFKSNVLLVCLVFLLASCGGDRGVGKLFQGTPRKGPNIYSPQGPKGKSRTQRYGQSVKKKKSKRKNKAFSSKKKRYGSTVGGGKAGKNKGAKSASGGRKSGKGRKKSK